MLLLLFTPSGAHAQAVDSANRLTSTREQRLAVFDDVWRSVRDLYYDPRLHRQPWEELGAQLRPAAADAPTHREFYVVLRRLLRHLRDSHTRVYAPDEPTNWPPARPLTTGVAVREVGGQLVIARVERGSAAQRGGIRTGDLLVRIDGREPRALLSRLLREEVSASLDETAQFQAVARLLDGPRDETVAVTFANRDGRERTVALARRELGGADELKLRRVSDRVWVVEFDAFTPAAATTLIRALRRELRSARAIVLDLRNNGGGEAEAMAEMASAFLPAGISLGSFIDRRQSVFLAPSTRATPLFSPDPLVRFTGPLAILTSEKTASAAEVLIAALKENRRASVIGTRTCGCVLGVRRHHGLADGGTLDLSETDYRTAGGVRLEGAGITPDEIVPLTLRDLRAGHDAPLASALEFFKDQAKARTK
ncbi:MAG TPA: S41 family peptidase [Pyrinomonadaceae bacterium]|nr:S41 family peptidase [Pyrinomonadaceae bacterium]